MLLCPSFSNSFTSAHTHTHTHTHTYIHKHTRARARVYQRKSTHGIETKWKAHCGIVLKEEINYPLHIKI